MAISAVSFPSSQAVHMGKTSTHHADDALLLMAPRVLGAMVYRANLADTVLVVDVLVFLLVVHVVRIEPALRRHLGVHRGCPCHPFRALRSARGLLPGRRPRQ